MDEGPLHDLTNFTLKTIVPVQRIVSFAMLVEKGIHLKVIQPEGMPEHQVRRRRRHQEETISQSCLPRDIAAK